MRPVPLVSLTSLALAVAAFGPTAEACTIENCVEARLARAFTAPSDAHALTTECAVAGRAGVSFQVTGSVVATGHAVAREVWLRCVLYAGGTVVLDRTGSADRPVAGLTASVVANPNVRICATATATWADGHVTTLADCTAR